MVFDRFCNGAGTCDDKIFGALSKAKGINPLIGGNCFSICSANNRTSTLSFSGWHNNHELSDRIPGNFHRSIKIVPLLTSPVFK